MSFIKQVKATAKSNKDTRSALKRTLDTIKERIADAAEDGKNELWLHIPYEEEKRVIAILRRMKFKARREVEYLCEGGVSLNWLVRW